MKVLVTGSRNHDPEWVCGRILEWLAGQPEWGQRLTIIHGDATGADQGAHLASVRIPECAEVRVPAQWETFGRSAGPRRNVEMLDDYEPHVVLAFPVGESRGTRHCMAAARERSIGVVEFEVPEQTEVMSP